MQRVYSPERDFDLVETVRDGDLLLIPWGYHTTAAAHGHDLYYLNVLAGPAPKRTLQAFQDPCLKATQDAWPELGIDATAPSHPALPQLTRGRRPSTWKETLSCPTPATPSDSPSARPSFASWPPSRSSVTMS